MNTMPYVYGHPRNGTHYVALLIKEALFPKATGDYLEHYGGHIPYGWHRKDIMDNIMTPAVYVYRNPDDALKSLFGIRNRFGIGISDFDQFLQTRYQNMFDPNIDAYVEYHDKDGEIKDFRVEVCDLFADVAMTPPEYHEWHFDVWRTARDLKPSLVKIVEYDELVNAKGKDRLEYLASVLNAKIEKDSVFINNKVGWVVPTKETKGGI